jgi:hypothetical protein
LFTVSFWNPPCSFKYIMLVCLPRQNSIISWCWFATEGRSP